MNFLFLSNADDKVYSSERVSEKKKITTEDIHTLTSSKTKSGRAFFSFIQRSNSSVKTRLLSNRLRYRSRRSFFFELTMFTFTNLSLLFHTTNNIEKAILSFSLVSFLLKRNFFSICFLINNNKHFSLSFFLILFLLEEQNNTYLHLMETFRCVEIDKTKTISNVTTRVGLEKENEEQILIWLRN